MTVNENAFWLDSIKEKDFFDMLNVNLFTHEFATKDVDVPTRVIHHWRSVGLLMEKERQYDENYKFNFMELMWLKIVLELRLFGLSIEKIKIAKDLLTQKKPLCELLNLKTDQEIIDWLLRIFSPQVKNHDLFLKVVSDPKVILKVRTWKVSIFELALYSFIMNRDNCRIFTLNDGSSFFSIDGNLERTEEGQDFLRNESYITIPIFKLVKNFLSKEDNHKFALRANILNSTEAQIFFLLQCDDFESVEVQFKEGKPYIATVKQIVKIEEKARLNEILVKRAYDSITINQQNGQIVYSTRTTKIKF